MKLLAILGSFALFVYLVVLIIMTVMNVSRTLFDPLIKGHDGHGFLARQGFLVIWPIAVFSRSGIAVFKLVWEGIPNEEA